MARRRALHVSCVLVLALAAVMLHAQVPARGFRIVTDATLQNPDPADWIHWRRTADGWGYSPLNQITLGNVATLQLAWSWAMQPGHVEPTPLIYDGVMYLPNPTGVQALDAATGDFVWEYKRQGPIAGRNIALYHDKILVNTADAHVLALEAATGKVLWDTAVPDPQKKGFRFSSGGIIAKGKLVSGVSSCARYRDDTCYIMAHDPDTGRELWRTSTVARAGEPGGDSWGSVPNMFRAGGEPWMPGTYDPALNLVYWGTAQAKPWAQAQRGSDTAALYTSSTLAIDPDTGRIAWYFQHIPGESHDMDEVYPGLLIDHNGRPSLFKMGKIGVLWELDRRTGRFLNAHDLGYQTLLTIDAKTGEARYKADVLPKIDAPVDYCPGAGGLKNLWEMAYHPETHAFYIPLKLSCGTSTFRAVEQVEGGGSGNGPADRKAYPHPKSPKHLGELLAVDRQGNVLWRHRNALPYDTAALTTGGGLVFIGDLDRNFSAFDVRSGRLLWQTRLPSAAEGFPVTFSSRGRQYVAVTSGPGPEFIWLNVLDIVPGARRVPVGMTVQVFALPDPVPAAK